MKEFFGTCNKSGIGAPTAGVVFLSPEIVGLAVIGAWAVLLVFYKDAFAFQVRCSITAGHAAILQMG